MTVSRGPRDGVVFGVDFEQCYSHVYIQDLETDEVLPPLQSGEERYSAGESILLVVTRPDTEGTVRVEFFMREAPDDLAADILYEGILNFPSGVVSLATVGAADEDIFELPAPGRWNIKVFTEGSPRPDYIRVIFRSAD